MTVRPRKPVPAQVAAPPLVPRYAAPGGYDESIHAPAAPRPHWGKFFDSLKDLGAAELARRWRDAQYLIRENGVTYNVYGDPRGIARPWQLDPIPLVVASVEAAQIEAGLIQRARLLELILGDLYGPQRLLESGELPAELVFPNPGFLRPCHGITPPGGRFLHLYSANLGRGADGRWRVLGDRTQAPSGAGYALENRIVMARTLPEAFRDCRVHRLALFFRTFRDALRSLAPQNRDNPRIVLLTPGPLNETYFEHAYLARYLGYTLAEGGDLTVRDNRVYLKVLGGLQPVDVIFRRLDDDFCDPLELRPDSFLGLPGLTNAVRCGTVAVANALGTGVLETPAIPAYLPALCRSLLGEELLLESVPTWWCGDADGRRYVLEHLAELVIKPAFSTLRFDPLFPAEMSSAERDELANRIRARPTAFIAQARVDLSTAPVLADGELVPRRMVLRTYVAADGDGFAVMPGGLTRVSGTVDELVVSMQKGGGSKDTWMLSDGPVSDFSLLAAGGKVELTRGGGLPSRSADNLFWLGRYAERADGTTRLLRGILLPQAEFTGTSDSPEVAALTRALLLRCRPTGASAADPQAELLSVTFDSARAGSLATVVASLLRVAGSVRDRISLDMWRALSGLFEFPTELEATFGPEGPTTADLLGVLNRTVLTLSAFGGMAVESMTRSDGWRFLDMGRRLERAVHMTALLTGAMIRPPAQEGPVLDAVLTVADSGMTYRRRYLGSLRAEAVLDLLVFDETNPRSLAAQLVALEEIVGHLPRSAGTVGRSPEQRLALTALTAVRLADPIQLAAVAHGVRVELQSLMAQVGGALPELSDAITQQYLTHLQSSRHLAAPDPTRRTAADSGEGI